MVGMVVACGAVLAGLVPGAAAGTQPADHLPVRTIAVLALENLRPHADTDWIGPGAAETLTTKLTGVNGLVAVERSQIKLVLKEQNFQQMDLTEAATAVQVGRVLGAERLLVGSYVCDGDLLVFNCRVVDVQSAAILYATTVYGRRSHVFDAIGQLADAVIRSFEPGVPVAGAVAATRPAESPPRLALTEAEQQALAEPPTTRPEAYEAFGRGTAAEDPLEQLAWYSKAIDADPNYADAYVSRGVIYLEQKDYAQAIQDMTRAVELEPTSARAWYYRGLAYAGAKQTDLAIQNFTKAIALKPVYAVAYSRRGMAYWTKGFHHLALQDYDHTVRLTPGDPTVYYYRGQVYARQNEPARAVQEYTRAIALNPNYVNAYYRRAQVYEQMNQPQAAVQDYTRAIQCRPTNPRYYADRAAAYYKLRAYDNAWADVNRARAMGYAVNPRFLADLARASGRSR